MSIASARIFYDTKNLSECRYPNVSGLRKKVLHLEYQEARNLLDRLALAISKISLDETDFDLQEDDCAHENACITRRQVLALLDEVETYLRDHHAYLENT